MKHAKQLSVAGREIAEDPLCKQLLKAPAISQPCCQWRANSNPSFERTDLSLQAARALETELMHKT